MKIAFLMNHFDRTDITKYPRSVGYYIVNSLEKQGVEVETIPPSVPKFTELYYKVKQAIFKYIFKKQHLRYCELGLIKQETKIRNKRIKEIKPDFIFSFGPLSSIFLEDAPNIAYWADACFPALNNYNPNFSNLSQNTVRNFNFIEQRGFDKAKAVFYSSEWAYNSAINNYNIEENKLHVLPLGANIQTNHNSQDIGNLVQKKLNNKICKFVFVGTNWKYKGAEHAIKIIQKLNDSGFQAQLTIIGCKPPNKIDIPSFVHIENFIDTSTDRGLNTLINYYKEANFFLLPTIVESFGHVFCEANAFGLPVISCKTGGVPSVVHNGKNGQLFDLDATIEDYCNYIIKIYKNKESYFQLCLSSFNEYKTRLNWDYGAKIIVQTLNNFL